MLINPNTKIGQFVIENYQECENDIEYSGGRIFERDTNPEEYPDLGYTLKFYDDAIGDLYLFGGHLMYWAIIRADSFESAYDIYLTEFAGPGEEPEDEKDAEWGSYDSVGGWHSETTLAYIFGQELSKDAPPMRMEFAPTN